MCKVSDVAVASANGALCAAKRFQPSGAGMRTITKGQQSQSPRYS
jgi:hypothetical protein